MFGRHITRRIKELQADKADLTKDRVARLSGMSRQHLWRALRGDSVLTAYELAQLARVLGLPAKEVYDSFWASVPKDKIGGITPWSYEEMSEYLRHHPIEPDHLHVKEGDARFVLTVGERGVYSAEDKQEIARRLTEDPRSLPRELAIAAQEFRLEAMRSGADERELSFIDSVLSSPEAIFRQSGYRGVETLTLEEQRGELEAVIAMLRQWLQAHLGKRRLEGLRVRAEYMSRPSAEDDG